MLAGSFHAPGGSGVRQLILLTSCSSVARVPHTLFVALRERERF